MAITATVTSISTDGNGVIRIRFGKREREFPSLRDLQMWAIGILDRDALEALAVALMLTRQPTLSNPSVFVGHSVTVDFTAPANWGTLS